MYPRGDIRQPMRKVLGFVERWYYQAHSAAAELREDTPLVQAAPVIGVIRRIALGSARYGTIHNPLPLLNAVYLNCYGKVRVSPYLE
jgi:hypothetical protein